MVSSQLPGIRSKTLLVMEALLRNDTCLKQVAPVPNIIRTLRQILPAVDDADKAVLLRILSSLVCRESSVADLLANDGMRQIVHLAGDKVSPLANEVLALVRIVCSLSSQQRKAVRSGDDVRPKPIPSERGGSLFLGKMLSGLSDMVKTSSARSRLSTFTENKNNNEDSEQTKVAVLTATSLSVERARRKAYFDAQVAKCDSAMANLSSMPSAESYANIATDDEGVQVNLLNQGVMAFVLSALSQVDEFKRFLAIIEVIQLMLDECPSAQIEFAARGGYKAVLGRLEHFAHPPEDFLAIEDNFEAVLSAFTTQALFSRSTEDSKAIENIFALHLFVDLVASSSISLLRLGVRIMQLILKTKSVYVIDLELAGSIPGVCLALANIISGFPEEHSDSGYLATRISNSIQQANVFDTLYPELPSNSRSIPASWSHVSLAGSPQNSNLASSGTPPIPQKSRDTSSSSSLIFETRMMMGMELILLLQHIAIITSQRDSQILAFFVSILFALTKNMSNPTEFRGFASKCQNCENAPTQFECTHPSCMVECCYCVCFACDAVLHKALIRRGHFRLPVNLISSLRPCLSLIDPGLHFIIRNCFFSGPGKTFEQLSLAPICILLNGIRGLIDDRRARDQYIPGSCLEPIVMTQRALISLTAQILPGSQDIVDAQFQTLLSRLADYRDDVYLTSCESIEVEEPPEIHQFSPLRIAFALTQQVLSRFFFMEKMKSAEWTGFLFRIFQLFFDPFYRPIFPTRSYEYSTSYASYVFKK